MVIQAVDKRVLDSHHIGLIYAEINSPQNFIDDILVFGIFQSYEFLPLLCAILL